MIIKDRRGVDIIERLYPRFEKRIAFDINCEGINVGGFAGLIARRFWPELELTDETKLGTVLTKESNHIDFFALCCYSIRNGWPPNQKEVIKQCFDLIPGDQPIAAVISPGSYLDRSRGDAYLILEGMQESKKKIILY